ncbi:Cupredoxin [Bisporella sp. PMI_857]|nr:Cupredoxin [Bisporella sp. PMI_857]KAH8600564.1 Cupredoxin [Bisporella sp. PMI_857]
MEAVLIREIAQDVKVHVVRVGALNGTLAYFPNKLTAAVGDMVQFQFAPANHTVTQSTGFMPVSANSEMTPIFTIQVNDTKPMWLYCSKGQHCQNGMTMVINENTNANASRSLQAYQQPPNCKPKTSHLAPSHERHIRYRELGQRCLRSNSHRWCRYTFIHKLPERRAKGSSATALSVPALAGVVAMVFAFAL